MSPDGPGGLVEIDTEQARMLSLLSKAEVRIAAVLDHLPVRTTNAALVLALGESVAQLVDARVRVLTMRRRAAP